MLRRHGIYQGGLGLPTRIVREGATVNTYLVVVTRRVIADYIDCIPRYEEEKYSKLVTAESLSHAIELSVADPDDPQTDIKVYTLKQEV
jgi:hypothetical protein